MAKKKKVSIPLTKEQKRANWVRRILLWCVVASLALLFVQLVDRAYTVRYTRVLDLAYAAMWLFMELEAIGRIRAILAEKKGFKEYWKLNRLECIYVFLSPVAVLLSFFVPGARWLRWIVALKLPNALGRYNDENTFQTLVNIGAVVLIIFFITPYFNLVSVAISKPGQIIGLLPKNIDFWGVRYVLTDRNFWHSVGISLFITAVGTVLSVTVTSLAAYPFAKQDMPFKREVMIYFLITMYFSGGMAPSILLMNALHLMDTIWVLILPGLMSTYNMLLMKSFFESLPGELEEAAKIDGASNLFVFGKIMIPLAKPMVATISFFQIVGIWNNYGSALLYISQRKDLYPMANYIRNFLAQSPQSVAGNNPTLATYWNPVEKSYLFISIIPIMLIYPFVFKYIKNGVTVGSVKG